MDMNRIAAVKMNVPTMLAITIKCIFRNNATRRRMRNNGVVNINNLLNHLAAFACGSSKSGDSPPGIERGIHNKGMNAGTCGCATVIGDNVIAIVVAVIAETVTMATFLCVLPVIKYLLRKNDGNYSPAILNSVDA